MKDKPHSQIEVETGLEDQALRVCLRDLRSHVFAQFSELTESERLQLARDSWMLGLSAVSNAYSRAQAEKLSDVGSRLMEDLDEQLAAHLEKQQDAVAGALRQYFDPKDGKVSERLSAFVDDQGALALLLRQYVGSDNSVLAQALAQQIGENSPLFRKLSATESDGVIQLFAKKVEEALEANRTEVAKALDPLADGGAVKRFLDELRKEIEEDKNGQEAQLSKALRALDQNDDGSLISTMMRETKQAHDELRKAVNPHIEGSPLASIKNTLEEMLSGRLGDQEKRLKTMQQEQREFYTNVNAAVERIETRRKEEARSTHGGNSFEDEVHYFATHVVQGGLCTIEATGNTTGVRSNCKVGDTVIEFSEESAYAGSRVVIESKRDKRYQVGEALAELETALDNRRAQVGLFVLAKESAPVGFPAFQRFGSRIVVVWDRTSSVSDGLLHGAIVCALALAQRKEKKADTGDIQALAKFEQDLVKELSRLAKIDGCASTIRNKANSISDEVRKGEKVLDRVIRNAKKTLLALNVELDDEREEAANPITFNGYEAPKMDEDEFDFEESDEDDEVAA